MFAVGVASLVAIEHVSLVEESMRLQMNMRRYIHEIGRFEAESWSQSVLRIGSVESSGEDRR